MLASDVNRWIWPRFDPVVVQEALLRQAAELFRPPVLSLDWVELKGGCRALVALLAA
jgi:hypothetical protein